MEHINISELVHRVIEGLISWRYVYEVISGICFFGLILLYDVCQTIVLVILDDYGDLCLYVLMLELVL